MCIKVVEEGLYTLKFVPDRFTMKEMCEDAVACNPSTLHPDHFKTQEMCDAALRKRSPSLRYVPDHFKTQGMCNEAVEKNPHMLKYIPDHLKT